MQWWQNLDERLNPETLELAAAYGCSQQTYSFKDESYSRDTIDKVYVAV